ncbi:MAG: CHAT domain-containing protein [Thermoguttaceae bacterium]
MGANKSPEWSSLPDCGHDGILTALEISTLELDQTDLVVISACETALGANVGMGEPSMSLQRAFRIAGAKTVLSSLWKVDDQQTQELMREFYTNLVARKQSKAAALHNAQKEMLKQSRADSAHPLYWAAWVLTGDPGVARAEASVGESRQVHVADNHQAPHGGTGIGKAIRFALGVILFAALVAAWLKFSGRFT